MKVQKITLWIALLGLFGCFVAAQNVLDNFSSVAYTNNNGAQNWGGNWTEANDDGSANTGTILIIGDQLRIGSTTVTTAVDDSIGRSANLSTASMAVLTFTISQTGVDSTNDAMVIEIANGTGAYTVQETFRNLSATTKTYTIPSSLMSSDTRIRFRVTEALESGEYFSVDNVQIMTAFDYGDAPDTGAGTAVGNYQTLASDGGPSHFVVTGLNLGSVAADNDSGSLQNATATSDDTDGTDDEDGVTLPRMTAGQSATFDIAVIGTGYLNGWVDWNGDGDFTDTSEQIVTNVQDNGTGDSNTASGTIRFSVTVPSSVTSSTTYARFRWNSTSGLTSIGAASDGEVEDYVVSNADLGIAKTGTSSVTVNNTVSYTLTVTNAGPANATGLSITDTVPSYITVTNWACSANGTASCGTASGSTNSISLSGNINAGSGNSLTITVTGVATTAGSITNTARVSPPTGTLDPVSSNNSSNQATTISAATFTPPTLSSTTSTPICAVPGNNGDSTVSGVINTYYGSASTNQTVPAGSTSVTLEAARGASTPISVGDLVLFIQMQDAEINTTDTRNYGGNNGSGSSYTSLGNSGLYEYVVATNDVPVTGGTFTFNAAGSGDGLVNTYTNADPSATRGQRSFQIIRVPQYANATISGTLSAAKWNGKSGGVVVVDVAGTLTWNAGSIIDVELAGFRAGYAPAAFSGNASGTIYRCSDKTTCGAGKGEGIAGTPANLWDGSAAITTGSGYPDGTTFGADYGMGAPANGGGGGGFHNAGGGGGSNGGAGGKGGIGWAGQSTTNDGGEPGVPLPPEVNRLFMGGGGGGGDANNALTGVRGGVGAGIVIVRAGVMTGTGTIEADGDIGDKGVYGSAPDGAGGGGAGGSVLLYAKNTSSASVTVNARGGAGGNTENDINNEHGPGGGGSGGLVVYNVPGGTVNAIVIGGSAGRANNGAGITHGAQDGTSGHTLTFTTTNDPFANGGDGSTCVPQLTVDKSTSTPTRSSSDTTATYTITLTNATGKGTGRGISITDDLPAPFTYAGGAITPVYAGGASGPASITGTGTDPVTFGTAGGDDTNSFTIPADATVSLTFDVNLNSASEATYQNPATVSYTDPTSATATVSPGGTDSLGQSVPGLNYASGSSTNEDITIGEIILGIAKALDRIIHGNDATDNLYTLVYRLTLENFSTVALSDLELFDDVVTQFSGLSPSNYNIWILANSALLSPAATLTLNGSWDGTAASNILTSGQSIAIGDTEIVYISFDVIVDPTVAAPNNTLRDNSATANGTSPSSTVVSDTSTNGTDPDGTDNDDTPDESDVTPASFVKLIKEVRNCGSSLSSCSGAYVTSETGEPGDYLEYRIRYYNISSQAISTLEVSDTLVTETPFQEDTYSLLTPSGIAEFSLVCPDTTTVDLDRTDAAMTTTPAVGPITSFEIDVMAATVCNVASITPAEHGYLLFKVKIP